MVKSGQALAAEIAEVGYSAPVGTPAGIEVLQLSELRSRVDPRALVAPQRPTFHHLMTLSSGALTHTVDFTDHHLEPGAWLWIRPGQVHQWHDLRQARHLGGPAQSSVSAALACLRDCGIAESRPQGRASLWSLSVQPELLELLAAAERLLAATGDAITLCSTYGEAAHQ